MLPSQPNRSIIDGLACLQVIVTSAQPIGTKQIAESLNFDVTRVNRLLKTFAHLGMIQQVEGRKYTSGPGVHLLAAQALQGSGLLPSLTPLLKPLRQFDMSISVGTRWNHQICYLLHSSPEKEFIEGLGAARVMPAFGSVIGIALIAELNDPELKNFLSQESFDNSGTKAEVFKEALKETKKNGYALLERESPGDSAVSIALPWEKSVAIALSGKIASDQLRHRGQELKEIVQNHHRNLNPIV